MNQNERPGEPIYTEGPIEIRYFPNSNFDEHNVWIGKNYFLFQRGCLEHFAINTLHNRLSEALNNYDAMITHSLKEAKITPTEFALILARARAKELQDEVSASYGQIRNLEDIARVQ